MRRRATDRDALDAIAALLHARRDPYDIAAALILLVHLRAHVVATGRRAACRRPLDFTRLVREPGLSQAQEDTLLSALAEADRYVRTTPRQAIDRRILHALVIEAQAQITNRAHRDRVFGSIAAR